MFLQCFVVTLIIGCFGTNVVGKYCKWQLLISSSFSSLDASDTLNDLSETLSALSYKVSDELQYRAYSLYHSVNQYLLNEKMKSSFSQTIGDFFGIKSTSNGPTPEQVAAVIFFVVSILIWILIITIITNILMFIFRQLKKLFTKNNTANRNNLPYRTVKGDKQILIYDA